MFNEFFVVFTHVQEDLTQLPPRRQVTVLKELNDITFYVCKGVTMPTNKRCLIWLTQAGCNYNVLMCMSPLIAGTGRRAYLLHAGFALRDSRCPCIHW